MSNGGLMTHRKYFVRDRKNAIYEKRKPIRVNG